MDVELRRNLDFEECARRVLDVLENRVRDKRVQDIARLAEIPLRRTYDVIGVLTALGVLRRTRMKYGIEPPTRTNDVHDNVLVYNSLLLHPWKWPPTLKQSTLLVAYFLKCAGICGDTLQGLSYKVAQACGKNPRTLPKNLRTVSTCLLAMKVAGWAARYGKKRWIYTYQRQ